MKSLLSQWTPPPDVRDHTGSVIAPNALFFAPPPPEIGRILTAHSGTYSTGSALDKPTARKVVGLFALFGILVGGFLGIGVSGGSWLGAFLGALLGGALIGGLIYRREGRKRDCTYTGVLGIARYRYPGKGRAEVLLFADAAELQTAFLGRNMGTNFNFQWKNAQGKCLYKLEGGYYATARTPDPESPYYFARAGERAWSAYLMPQLTAELKAQGSCRFIINRSFGQFLYARIGYGYLELGYPKQTFHLKAHDIEDVLVFQGVITIRRRGAQEKAINSMSGANGIFYLSYGTVSNVELFLQCLQQVAGVPYRRGD